MKNLSIRNFALGLVVCLGASAGYSSCVLEDVLWQKSTSLRPTMVEDGWHIQIKENAARASWGQVSVSIDKCGEVHVRGEGNCISNAMKKHAVQLLELERILLGVDAKYDHCHIGKLIAELEQCPCPVEPKRGTLPVKTHDDCDDDDDDRDCHGGKKIAAAVLNAVACKKEKK